MLIDVTGNTKHRSLWLGFWPSGLGSTPKHATQSQRPARLILSCSLGATRSFLLCHYHKMCTARIALITTHPRILGCAEPHKRLWQSANLCAIDTHATRIYISGIRKLLDESASYKNAQGNNAQRKVCQCACELCSDENATTPFKSYLLAHSRQNSEGVSMRVPKIQMLSL